MAARYGMPYRGSKNRIAREIVDALPPAKHFYDLFGGGGAITCAALESGKWRYVHYNELDPRVADTFRAVMTPGYEAPLKWVSREDFHARKDRDGVIAMCWSFDSALCRYLYGREVEPWKRALWAARVDNDTQLFRAMGVSTDGTSGDIRAHQEEYKRAYVTWYKREVLRLPEAECGYRAYPREALRASGLTVAAVDRHLESLQRLESLDSLPRLWRLQHLQHLRRLGDLVVTCGSYDAVPLERDAVIYCDPPYKGTGGYALKETYLTAFDSARFFDWASRQSAPVYVSEMGADDRFIPVWRKDLVGPHAYKGTGQIRTELLVTPRSLSKRRPCRGQWELYYGT